LIVLFFDLFYRWELFAVRSIVQNGLAFYAAWVTIATLLNFAIVLTYWAHVQQSTACSICLFILLAELVLYAFLENVVWREYLHYTYTPWFVVIFALIGSIVKNWNAEIINSMFLIVLLAFASSLFFIKVTYNIWWQLLHARYKKI
jgi:hypothetical protein